MLLLSCGLATMFPGPRVWASQGRPLGSTMRLPFSGQRTTGNPTAVRQGRIASPWSHRSSVLPPMVAAIPARRTSRATSVALKRDGGGDERGRRLPGEGASRPPERGRLSTPAKQLQKKRFRHALTTLEPTESAAAMSSLLRTRTSAMWPGFVPSAPLGTSDSL